MAANWNIMQPVDTVGAVEQGFKQYQQGRAQNAMAAYAQNPNDQTLNSLAKFAPEYVVQQKQKQVTDQQAKIGERVKLIGQAAQWADTPEKWDVAIDHLVGMGYSDLAQYKGRFSENERMAAITAAGEYENYAKQNEQYTLAPGSIRFDAKGNQIAAAPFSPHYATVKPGETVVADQPGQGIDTKSLFPRMIGVESNGQQFAADGKPLTSGAGAIGIAQVMPGTAPEAAQLAGVAFDENRYRNDPEYNRALGEAYFNKQLSDFGDPAQAVAAYNAGPGRVRDAIAKGGADWLSYLPAETKAYVAKVMGNNAPRVVARGGDAPPKPKWRTLTPQEATQRGLPAGTWQESPDGEIKPVSGTTGNNAPAPGTPAYSQSAMDAFDRAIASASRLLSHGGLNAAVGVPSINPLDGNLAGYIVPGSRAADFRAELEAMKAQIFLPMVQSMKGMGALSNAEGDKLAASIGALDPKMSEGAFKASLKRIIGDLNTYKARATNGAPRAAAPARGQAPARKPSVSNW